MNCCENGYADIIALRTNITKAHSLYSTALKHCIEHWKILVEIRDTSEEEFKEMVDVIEELLNK